ncbi:trace amine-associated receptor 365-like [Lampetra fluviatilis]
MNGSRPDPPWLPPAAICEVGDFFLNCSVASSPAQVRAVIQGLLTLLITATVAGNLLIIIAVATSRQLRTQTNAFIASMAVADFLVGLTVMPYSMMRSVHQCWYYGRTFCKAHTCLEYVFTTASILHLGAIAFDRHTAICDPLRYRQRITPRRVAHLLAASWLLPFLYVPPVSLGWNVVGVEEAARRLSCPDSCVVLKNVGFALVDTCCAFFAPTALMLVAYARIYRVARRQARQIAASSTGTVSVVAASVKQQQQQNHLQQQGTEQQATFRRTMKREHNATKTLAIILGAFVVCWCPYFVASAVDPFVGFSTEPTLLSATLWLCYANSALNPVLYAAFNRRFRAAFSRIFCRGKGNAAVVVMVAAAWRDRRRPRPPPPACLEEESDS